jgi:CheY-like chemotaxis protein
LTRVLVIDDEAPIRLLCRVNLEAEKMEVFEAKDGPTGLEEAKRTDPDVILLDVMMPMLDGWRVAEHLLDDPKTKDIPIIFLTAPFNPLELASLVRNLLDRIERGERDDLRKEKLSELRMLMESE